MDRVKRSILPILTVAIFVSIIPTQLNAQAVRGGEYVYDGPLVLDLPILTQRPPITTDMPYNVLIAYILTDSLARTTSKVDFLSIWEPAGYSDTLRYAMKYHYVMNDYDPVRFSQWGGLASQGTYACPPGWLDGKIVDKVAMVAPEPKATALLIEADIIAHIKVTNLYLKTSENAAWAKTAILVTTEVVEPIKGAWLPYCKAPNGTTLETTECKHAAIPGACLQFDYRLEWPRLNHSDVVFSSDSTLGVPEGEQWVKYDEEYIVFLELASVPGNPRDSVYMSANHRVPMPLAGYTTTGGMYPIIDGHVYDPYDDLGLGSNLTTQQWKSQLWNKINAIKNFGN